MCQLRPPFYWFPFFLNIITSANCTTVNASEIRTLIAKVDGKHADHYPISLLVLHIWQLPWGKGYGSRYRATGYWFLYWMKDQKELNKVAFDLISKYSFTMRASSVDTLICLGKIPKLRQSIRLQLARTIGQNKMHVLIELKSMTFNLPRWKFLLCRFSGRLISAKLSNKFGGYCLSWTVSIALACYNTTA